MNRVLQGWWVDGWIPISAVNVDPANMDISGERVRADGVIKQELYEFANPTPEIKSLSVIDPHGNSLPMEAKETNNNHVTLDMSSYCSDLWPTIDSSVLEELNSWTQEVGVPKGDHNTDGAIYTLTVLNGTDQSSWFKSDEKEEKLPTNPSLDLDSLLNVIPSNFGQTFPTEVKTEYTFEDSGFEDKKEEVCESLATDISLNSPSNFNNNNEWKHENNNEVDSLLRSALTGKSLVRYNGIKKEPIEVKQEEDEKMILDNQILYETPSLIDSDNPSSAHSMDELFLNHLDSHYADDYEKLKSIENEVAGIGQFCLDQAYLPSGSQLPVNPGMLPLSNNKPIKKYTKRQKNAQPGAGAPATPGPRKERSLHYCTICSKGFKDKYSVNVHIRTHTGEKPFNCSLCGKSFRQKAHLAKHYQTHLAQAKNGLSTSSKSAKNLISSS